MTPLQRAHRLRQIDRKRDSLQADLRALDIEARPLEIEEALSLGMPTLRGKLLIDAMDREAELARKREQRQRAA